MAKVRTAVSRGPEHAIHAIGERIRYESSQFRLGRTRGPQPCRAQGPVPGRVRSFVRVVHHGGRLRGGKAPPFGCREGP